MSPQPAQQPPQQPAPQQPVADPFFADVDAAIKQGRDESVLAKYPPRLQQMAKQLADYQAPVTPYMLSRSPAWGEAAEVAHEYDPSFMVGQYDTRQKLRNDYTSGATSKNITSLNTAIGHLDSLRDAATKLKNFGGLATPLNAPINWAESAAGDPSVNNYNERANAVSTELTRAFRGTGGSEADVKAWRDNLPVNGSPDQQKGAIDGGIDLLSSRVAALRDTYQRGMGKPPIDLPMLSPKSRQILTSMGYDPDKIEQGAKAKDARMPPARAGVQIGQSVPLKGGRTAKVTAVYPDGSFDTDLK